MAKLKVRPVEALSFDDVLIVPTYSDVMSRSETNTHTSYTNGRWIHIPIIASPMDTVTEYEMAQRLGALGGAAILHRYCTVEKQVRWVKNLVADKFHTRSAAIGASTDDQARAKELIDAGANVLCVDVANGDSRYSIRMIEWLKGTFPDVRVIGGNVATSEGFMNCVNAGADAVRVGIGGGSFCTTRVTTGIGIPTLQSILSCQYDSMRYDIPIIADGGIRNGADVAKAIAAGASSVMIGGLLVGTEESPGEVYEQLIDPFAGIKEQYKMGRGMASREVQEEQGKEHIYAEGISARVPYVGFAEQALTPLINGLRSAMSYTNSTTIEEFQDNTQFIKITPAGQAESQPHIRNLK